MNAILASECYHKVHLFKAFVLHVHQRKCKCLLSFACQVEGLSNIFQKSSYMYTLCIKIMKLYF